MFETAKQLNRTPPRGEPVKLSMSKYSVSSTPSVPTPNIRKRLSYNMSSPSTAGLVDSDASLLMEAQDLNTSMLLDMEGDGFLLDD